MNLFQTIGATLSAWTGSVAAAIVAGLERVVSPRVVRLLEGDDGGFAVEAELPDGRRNSAEVVILLLESGGEPYRILSWRNASDGSTGSQKASSR